MGSGTNEPIRVTIDKDLAELIPGFLENRRKDISGIMDAVAKNDFGTVRSIGHNIKGLGGGYGFDAITEMGAELESAAKSQDRDRIRRQAEALSLYLDRIEIVFQ